MSLSWRLIVAFGLVILLTLFLAFITLILVSRPLQNRLAVVRLISQSRQAVRQIDASLAQGQSLEQVARRINQRPPDSSVHLLLVNAQGRVLADSQTAWLGQNLDLPRQEGAVDSSGALRSPSGEAFNFAATPLGGGPESGYAVTVSPRIGAVPGVIAELGAGFAWAGGVALLAALLISVLLARSLALPLREISAATKAVAAGDYSQRVPEKGPPEVKQVAASFNSMAGQVAGSQQAMRDFVSNVSHELKTPLTSIQGFSQAIMEGATTDEAATRRAAQIIHEEAARMRRMVAELLDLARIDSGQVVMQQQPLDLPQILSGVVERLQPQAHQKEVELVSAWGDLPPVLGDGDRLAQVFTNLLDNALHHTPTGGRVTVRGEVKRATGEGSDVVSVSVSDTGPGIPAAELGRVFERFYQVDKSRQRSSKGTGLGLAISQEIVAAHGGRVQVESIEGVGTKFTVLLPL